MKKSEIQEELKKRNISATGLKDALVQRLKDALKKEAPTESNNFEIDGRPALV